MRLYHISAKYLGITPTLKPKLPQNALISKEGNIPRVCFSDDLALCVKSILGGSSQIYGVELLEFSHKDTLTGLVTIENPYVYSLEILSIKYNSQKIYIPPDASDFRENHECWSLRPIRVFYLDRLCLASFLDGRIKLTQEVNTLSVQTINDLKQKEITFPQFLKD